MDFQTSALILSWIAIALLALAVSGLMRQVRILSAMPGRARSLASSFLVGKPIPEFEGGALGSKKPTVLLFARPECDVCLDRLADLDIHAAKRSDRADFVAVFSGEAGSVDAAHVRILEHEEPSFSRFGVAVTPLGVAVSSEGIVSQVAPLGSSTALEDFVASVTGSMQ